MNTMKVAKQEVIKFMHQKKFIFLLIVFVICTYMMGSWMGDLIVKIKTETLTSDMADTFKNFLLSLNGVSFSHYVCQNFIYRDMFPIFLIFISLIVISSVSDDYEDGTMKFILISKVNKKELIMGKMFGILFIIAGSTLVFLIVSVLFGIYKFGITGINFADCLSLIYYYAISLIPEMAWSLLLVLICLLIRNKLVVTFASIIGVILLSNIDRLTVTKGFSPIGIIQTYTKLKIEEVNINNTILGLVVPIIYIALCAFISIRKFKKEDILL